MNAPKEEPLAPAPAPGAAAPAAPVGHVMLSYCWGQQKDGNFPMQQKVDRVRPSAARREGGCDVKS